MSATPDGINIAPLPGNESSVNLEAFSNVSHLIKGDGYAMPKADPGSVLKFNSIASALFSEPMKAVKSLSQTLKKGASELSPLDPAKMLNMQLDTMKTSVGINIVSKFVGVISQSLKQLTTIS